MFVLHEKRMNLFDDVCDDILIDILTRLPVRQILRCQVVCRRWCNLILNPTFAQLHLGRSQGAAQVPFVQIGDGGVPNKFNAAGIIGLYFVDWEDENQSFWSNRKRLQSVSLKGISNFLFSNMRLRCCCDGLLIFAETRPPYKILLCNPTTNETVVLGFKFRVCGFYFHLPTNSYRLLCVDSNIIKGCFLYYICGLDLVVIREVGVSPSSVRSEISTSSRTVDGFIYMQIFSESCSTHIVRYDLNTEKMTFLPHPPLADHPIYTHYSMHLIEMESQLGFGSFGNMNRTIDIWVLEDPANWGWTKKYSVKPAKNVFRFNREYSLSIRNQELVLWYPYGGIFRYHLVSGIAQHSPRYWHTYLPVFVTNGKRSFISPHHLLSHLNK